MKDIFHLSLLQTIVLSRFVFGFVFKSWKLYGNKYAPENKEVMCQEGALIKFVWVFEADIPKATLAGVTGFG